MYVQTHFAGGGTRTETIPWEQIVPQNEVPTLHFAPNPLVRLIGDIRQSSLFTQEEWPICLLQLDLHTEERQRKLENAREICKFLSDVLHSKVKDKQNDENLAKLLDFEDKLIEILKNILPDDIDIQTFIEECEDQFDKEKIERSRAAIREDSDRKKMIIDNHYAAVSRILADPQFKIAMLIERMRASGIFSETEAQINEWESSLNAIDFMTQERNQQEKSAALLCFFLASIIQPELRPEQTNEALRALYCFEDTVRDILKTILPKDVDVDEFIAQVERNFDEAVFERIKANMIDTFYREQVVRVRHFATLADPQFKIARLFERMRASGIFSATETQLDDWQARLRQINFNVQEKAQKERNGIVIWVFFDKVVRPAILCPQNIENQKKLAAFELYIKNILKNALPSDVEEQAFIVQCEGYLLKERVVRELFHTLDALFQELADQFTESANEVNKEMKLKYLNLKQRLLEINEKRKSESEELYKAIDSVTNEMKQLLGEIKANALAARNVGEKMQSERRDFQKLLQKLADVLKKV